MNYILFFPDEMRAESLHCYGHETIKTPAYDRLATQGTLFEQCHVQNPVCSPSRCSLMSGRYVHTSGNRTLWNLLKPYDPDLLRTMKDNGYDVHIFGKNDLYDVEAEPLAADDIRTYKSLNPHAENTAKFGEDGFYDFLYEATQGPAENNQDARCVQAALEVIKNHKEGDKPFVIFLPLLMPHCPYSIEEPFYSMYDPDKDIAPLREHGENKPSFHHFIRKYRELKDEKALRKIQAVYMGMISFSDHLLGQIMETMEETGRNKDTMLIATSDHGDYAGDYGLVEKWPNALEDVITHVPLIVKMPGGVENHRVKAPVALFDIMATMLETSKLEIKETTYAKSFLPQLMGEEGDMERAVYCEGGYDSHELHCNEGYIKPGSEFMRNPNTIYYPKGVQQKEHPETVCRSTMIRTLTHKFIMRTSGEHELYDLVNDPKEMCNVFGQAPYKEIQAELQMRMMMWYLETSDAVPTFEDNRNFTYGKKL